MSSLAPENALNNQNTGVLSRGEPRWVILAPVGMRVDLLIVIVSWNVADLLRENLRSLKASVGEFSAKVIVVDNASHDGTVSMLREEFPWVEVIANTENLGFAHANNQAIARISAKHVLLLNPDMRVEPETLVRAIAYADAHPEAGVVSGLLLTENGTPLRSVRRFPTVLSQLAVLLKCTRFVPRVMARYLANDLDLTKEQAVDSVRGSFFLLPERARRVLGGLDERYFIWFEEVDYCRRAHLAGFSVLHAPSIIAHDAVGKSFAKQKLFWKQNHFSRSMVTYFTTWEPWWQSLLLRMVRIPVLGVMWCIDRFRV